MTFNEWLSAQYELCRLNRQEIEQATDKLRKEIELDIDYSSRFPRECYRYKV